MATLSAAQILFLKQLPKVMPTGWEKLLLPAVIRPGEFQRRSDLAIRKRIAGPVASGKLALYARQRVSEPLDFSVGLVFTDDFGGVHHILRCNGIGHSHTNPFACASDAEPRRFADRPHIHFATAYCAARGKPLEGYAIPTKLYSEIEGAIQVLGRKVNIESQHDLFSF